MAKGHPCNPCGPEDNSVTVQYINLPSGASFPDWSVLTSDDARRAVETIMGILSEAHPWAHIDHNSFSLHNETLAYFGETGGAPSLETLEKCNGKARKELQEILDNLEDRNLATYSPETNTIAGTIPITSADTGHHVYLKSTMVFATCAVCALGIGSMFDENTVIRSHCALCDETIEGETKDKGRALDLISPKSAVVGVHLDAAGLSLAEIMSRAVQFFCCDEHRKIWFASKPLAPTLELTPVQALEVGRALWSPMFRKLH